MEILAVVGIFICATVALVVVTALGVVATMLAVDVFRKLF